MTLNKNNIDISNFGGNLQDKYGQIYKITRKKYEYNTVSINNKLLLDKEEANDYQINTNYNNIGQTDSEFDNYLNR